MVRSIAAVIIGYLVMVVPIVAVFSFYARKYGSKPGRAFMLIVQVVGFFAAILGGITVAMIAQDAVLKHAAALVGLSAAMWLVTPSEDEPLWVRVFNLLVMIGGVFLGASLVA
ncbi:MAG: hypothetical protein IID15_04940 [Candidatus Marinimicrobia bacterium]|nr:hypothetical protein [Candidatus Neomarinimicrobiota bacterium]